MKVLNQVKLQQRQTFLTKYFKRTQFINPYPLERVVNLNRFEQKTYNTMKSYGNGEEYLNYEELN